MAICQVVVVSFRSLKLMELESLSASLSFDCLFRQRSTLQPSLYEEKHFESVLTFELVMWLELTLR